MYIDAARSPLVSSRGENMSPAKEYVCSIKVYRGLGLREQREAAASRPSPVGGGSVSASKLTRRRRRIIFSLPPLWCEPFRANTSHLALFFPPRMCVCARRTYAAVALDNEPRCTAIIVPISLFALLLRLLYALQAESEREKRKGLSVEPSLRCRADDLRCFLCKWWCTFRRFYRKVIFLRCILQRAPLNAKLIRACGGMTMFAIFTLQMTALNFFPYKNYKSIYFKW